jgi:UDP-2,3-diacylglucosamine pyrophosphatase LpxH
MTGLTLAGPRADPSEPPVFSSEEIMLVAISDLHLTDEQTAINVSQGAFDILEHEIVGNAADRKADEIHLVLLGDILDLVRTDYWHRKARDGTLPVAQRPWNGTLSPSTAMNVDPGVERQFHDVLNGILANDGAQSLLEMIQHLHAAGLPFRVTYVIGNHDRVLHNFSSLQTAIREAMPGVPLTFAAGVREPRYGLIARHGHEWDTNCHGWTFHNEVLERGRPTGQFDEATYRVMAIGEVVTAELMSGIVFRFAEAAGSSPAAAAVLARLKDLNNLRPILNVFQWLDWFAGNEARKFYPLLHNALKQSLDGVIESGLARRWDELKNHVLPGAGDLIDHLEDIRRYAIGKNMDEFRSRVHTALPAITLLTSRAADHYLEGAIREMNQEEDPAFQFILYGHTHVAKHEYLTGDLDGRGRIYVNTGTYLPLITLARDGRTFASARQMTMTFAYAEDEDAGGKAGGPSLEAWAGIRRKQYLRK